MKLKRSEVTRLSLIMTFSLLTAKWAKRYEEMAKLWQVCSLSVCVFIVLLQRGLILMTHYVNSYVSM